MNYHKAPFPGFFGGGGFNPGLRPLRGLRAGVNHNPRASGSRAFTNLSGESGGWDESDKSDLSDMSDSSDSSDLSDRPDESGGWILGVGGGGARAPRPRSVVFCSLWDIVFLRNVVFLKGFMCDIVV